MAPDESVNVPWMPARNCPCAAAARRAAPANTKTTRKESFDRLMTCSFTPKNLRRARHPQLNRLTTPFGGEYSHLKFECQRFLIRIRILVCVRFGSFRGSITVRRSTRYDAKLSLSRTVALGSTC